MECVYLIKRQKLKDETIDQEINYWWKSKYEHQTLSPHYQYHPCVSPTKFIIFFWSVTFRKPNYRADFWTYFTIKTLFFRTISIFMPFLHSYFMYATVVSKISVTFVTLTLKDAEGEIR